MAAVSKTSRPPNHEPQSNKAYSQPRTHHSASANPNPTTSTSTTTTTTATPSSANPRSTASTTTTTPSTKAAAVAAAAAAVAAPAPTTTTTTTNTSSSTDLYHAAPIVNRPYYRAHLHSPSISSIQKLQRSGGLLGFAAAAFDKTQSALATFSSDQSIRQRASSSALGRASFPPDSASDSASLGPTDKYPRYRSPSNYSSSSSSTLNHPEGKYPSQVSLVQDIPSQPYSETDPTRPLPIRLPSIESKMHQTSSRLLRMTDDDRPFTKDFKDLFSTLIVSLLPLSAHRVRLTRVENTFLSEDAINNLGSLKFSQSNRMPDPKDPSRIVTTTTTTTFSMAKDMARSICQKFLEARFIESADGKYQQVYNMKGSVWQLTPKGVTVLDRFCSRNGIQQKSIADLVGSTLSQLVILERDGQTDKLITDRGTIEVIFRRFIGTHGPNVKASVSSADSDSLSDYKDGLTGVKMASERKVNGRTYKDTFTGKAATDWLMDCCTTVDRRETYDIASLFVEYDLIEPVVQDRAHMAQYPSNNLFQPTKHSIYQLTAKGKDLINGLSARGRTSESEAAAAAAATPSRNAIARDSNTQRLDKILNDAALRLLFRENLRETHCEENLSFYLDVDDFVRSCRQAIRVAQKNPNANSMDGIKEIMAQAYGIYNAFLAPGSPCELNIDHQLRNNLATRMTKAVGQDVAMIDTLQEVMSLFEDAQNAVFKLMASDSVPKFLRSPKYEHTLKNYDFDAITGGRGVERSTSRSNRK